MVLGYLKPLLLAGVAFCLCARASPVPAEVNASPAPGTISIPLHKVKRSGEITKRGYITASLANKESLYFIKVKIGSQAEQVALQIDTGSSDTFAFTPAACSDVSCVGGSFNPSKSSTFKTILTGGFDALYGDGTHVTGNLISDTLSVGGATIKALEMGLATAATGTTGQVGIMGVGFDTLEATAVEYPNIIDDMVSQGLIASRVFSLWLDDLESSSGTILFGGYNKSKYKGDLAILPLIPSASGVVRRFLVDFDSISVTLPTGTTVVANSFSYGGLMDSGTSLTILPAAVYDELATAFSVTSDGTINCEVAQAEGSLNFGFAGVTISIPFSELVLPETNRCRFGLGKASASETFAVFGDTFLRSAYVVFDLDHKEIGLAQRA